MRIYSLSTSAILLLASLSMPVFAADGQIIPAATPVVKKSNEKVMAELEAVKKAIGKAACDSNDQCKTVAMGAKACGGPEFFLAFSGKAEQAAKVPELAQKHRMAREAQIAAEGEMSDCKVVSDPGAQCNAGKCTLLPTKAGASAS